MPVIETALTRLLGIEHPILLAPMGSAAGGRLAAAVTNAGGLGMSARGTPAPKPSGRSYGSRQHAGRDRLYSLGARTQPGGARRGARSPAGRDHAVLRRSHSVYRPHQGRRLQDHLSGTDAGPGEGGGRCGRRHHHRAGTRRGRPFRDDARHDGAGPGGRRCRRSNPGGRRRRHRRRARPRRGPGARCGGRFRWARGSPPRASRCGIRR